MCNPLAAIITQMRKALVGGSNLLNPSAALRDRRRRAAADPARLIVASSSRFGVWLFNREAPRIAENL